MAGPEFWEKWEWRAWKTDPRVRRLTPISRLIWFELLGDMWLDQSAEWTGTPGELAQQIGVSFEQAETFITEMGVTKCSEISFECNGAVRIVSRRRRKLENARETTRLRVAKHREKSKTSKPVTPKKRRRNGTEEEEDRRSSLRSDLLLSDSEAESSCISDESLARKNGVKAEDVKTVLKHLNAGTGNAYRWQSPNGKPTAHEIAVRAILRKGYTVEDCLAVIDKQISEWSKDDHMAKFLTPGTLFRPSNFEKYLDQR